MAGLITSRNIFSYCSLLPLQTISRRSLRTLSCVSNCFIQSASETEHITISRPRIIRVSTACKGRFYSEEMKRTDADSVKTKVSSTSKPQYEYGSVLRDLQKREEPPKELTRARKVVEAGKDAGYTTLILVGLGITGVLLGVLIYEFFSSNSPQKLYAKALRMIKKHPQAIEMLGSPITGHGDYSGRNRRRMINAQEYIVNKEEHMMIVFYVSGSKRKGEAQMDFKKNEKGKYICRYLIVTLEGYPPATITLQDNRQL